ncbi:hypothetical protein D3C81_1244250 [compost metagenome]
MLACELAIMPLRWFTIAWNWYWNAAASPRMLKSPARAARASSSICALIAIRLCFTAARVRVNVPFSPGYSGRSRLRSPMA